MKWPPDYKAVAKERLKKLKALRRDPKVLAAAFVYYKTRPVQFILDWCVTYDPRLKGSKTVPFVLFDAQVRYIEWLWKRYNEREDGVVDKCRDMGVTWLCCAFALWLWIFYPGVKVAFGSRKQDLVDKLGDPDSIFEKIRYMLYRLPPEFRPRGFRSIDHDNYLKLINPKNGSTITGEAGDNIGRGGRSSIYFIDEAAHIDRPLKVDAALDDNTDCKVYVSTHNGPGTPFYQKSRNGKFDVFAFDWWDHPGKDQAWYDAEKARRDPANFAQEVDRNPDASLENLVIRPEWVKACRELTIRWGGGQRIGGFDIGMGRDLSVLIVRDGPIMEMPRSWNDADLINTANFGAEISLKERVACLNFDVYGIGSGVAAQLKRIPEVYAKGINTGDAPTKNRWPDGKTSREKFLNLKAELWWMLRDRCLKTFEYVQWLCGEGGREHPEDELISLPDHDVLCSELSTPTWHTTATGKIQIETKDQLAKRGIKSPDFADAAVLTFAPVKGKVKAGGIKGFY